VPESALRAYSTYMSSSGLKQLQLRPSTQLAKRDQCTFRFRHKGDYAPNTVLLPLRERHTDVAQVEPSLISMQNSNAFTSQEFAIYDFRQIANIKIMPTHRAAPF
jgi:hypothetical protein